MNYSVPTGSQLEFVNVTPLNNLISKCEIKVLYAGKNRNYTYITKEVANKMANSLPGTPIVGQYFLEAKDFGEHEEELVIDDQGVRFVKTTVPYGFVAPDAKVWWQNFVDKDGVEREYLLTEGFLWTGRYPECKRVVEQGNHQSMELQRSSMKGEWSKLEGEWSKNGNDEREYFIVNDATFSALCILGEDIEPCFEGASIKKSNTAYSLDKDDFKEQMLDFMADLKYALNNLGYEGGNNMEDLNNTVETVEEVVETVATETIETAETEADFAKKKKEDEEAKESKEKEKEEEKEPSKKEEEKEPSKKDEEPSEKEEKKEDSKEEEKAPAKEEEDEEKKKKKKFGYSLEEVVEYQELLEKFSALEGQYQLMEAELSSIKSEHAKYKAIAMEAENKAKDEMINSFYMLSDEDKKEVSENKANFSLEDIESKLSVICVRKKVNFDLDDSSKNEDNTEAPITTFNVGDSHSSVPAWLKAVDAMAKNRK